MPATTQFHKPAQKLSLEPLKFQVSYVISIEKHIENLIFLVTKHVFLRKI